MRVCKEVQCLLLASPQPVGLLLQNFEKQLDNAKNFFSFYVNVFTSDT